MKNKDKFFMAMIILFLLVILFIFVQKIKPEIKESQSKSFKFIKYAEPTGSTILIQSDCLDRAKEMWQEFDFEITEEKTDCKITYVSTYRDGNLEVECNCFEIH